MGEKGTLVGYGLWDWGVIERWVRSEVGGERRWWWDGGEEGGGAEIGREADAFFSDLSF